MVTLGKRADLLALVCCYFVTLPFGILGQVGYLIVSIPEPCFFTLHVLWGKGIMTSVPAWCVSAHASFVFKIDSPKTQCLLIALNKMQLLKKIILYVEGIFQDAGNEDGCFYGGLHIISHARIQKVFFQMGVQL